jgi:hypothetical protein
MRVRTKAMSRCRVSAAQEEAENNLIWSLVVNCWPSPSNDGTCEVNMEYELENEGVTLHDVVISIPLPYVVSSVT